MSFFDELTEKARSVANTAGEKAREAAESARISAQILKERRELDRSYRAIGQWYVAEGPDEADGAVADEVAAAKASLEKIRELQEKRDAAEEAEAREAGEPSEGRACPVCGKISASRYCPHCGAPME